MNTQIIDAIPLWAFFIINVFFTLICVECGFRVGRHRRQKDTKEHESSVNSMVSSTLSLLAFILGFTFGIAAARFDDRRVLVIEEANAIGTTYLRSDFIEEPYQSNIKHLLKEYVDVRVQDAVNPKNIVHVTIESDRLQNQLWHIAALIGQKHPDSIMDSLFINSLNNMIDLHAKRITATLHDRVPESIWGVLFLVAALSMAGVGYHSGLTGKRSWPASIVLVITFSAVMVLVADLDRPWEGLITVNQKPLIDISKKFDLLAPK